MSGSILGTVANSDEIERILIESSYCPNDDFTWVGIIIRYGSSFDTVPHYQKINKKHGDLPLAIEIDVNEILKVSQARVLEYVMEEVPVLELWKCVALSLISMLLKS